MTKVIPRQAQPAPPMPQPSQQVLVYDGIDTTKSELNALFTINSDLLERKVHAVNPPTFHSQTDRTEPFRIRTRRLPLPARTKQTEQCSSAGNPADRRESGHRSDAFRFRLGKRSKNAAKRRTTLLFQPRKELSLRLRSLRHADSKRSGSRGYFWNSRNSTNRICRIICAIGSCSSGRR